MSDPLPLSQERSRFLPERKSLPLSERSAFTRRALQRRMKELKGGGVSRRDLLRAAITGAAGLAADQFLPAHAATPSPSGQPTMGNPGTHLSVDHGPYVQWNAPPPRMNRYALGEPVPRTGGGKWGGSSTPDGVFADSYGADAVGGGTTGNLALVNSLLHGAGLYIGNEFNTWNDTQRQAVFHQIRSWGFSFVCPKVGGYSSTYYGSDTQLTNWKNWANAAGLQFLPFIYEIPSDAARGAQISADLAGVCGISVVDMEDEWGVSGSTNYNSQMIAYGNAYRGYCPNIPIIVTGYGDPTTRFGSTGWPFTQMAAWTDAYSPQWYYGDWTEYSGGGGSGVQTAINWGDGECSTAFGASFPLLPSLSIYDIYSTGVAAPVSSGKILPAHDVRVGSSYARLWKAPVIWWEYTDMTATVAANIV